MRIADFKNADDTKGHYDIIAEGNFKGTKVEPGKVSTIPVKLKSVGSALGIDDFILFVISFRSGADLFVWMRPWGMSSDYFLVYFHLVWSAISVCLF